MDVNSLTRCVRETIHQQHQNKQTNKQRKQQKRIHDADYIFQVR